VYQTVLDVDLSY